MATTPEAQWHNVTMRIPFASEKHANIAKQVIDVDRELQPDVVKRTLSVEGNDLVATFTTLTVRLARLTSNAFLENVDLVVRTIGEFGEDAEHVPIPPPAST
ncbi:transcription factor Pcc1-domain-containing protein [Dichomitus squalens]|uniref:Transcription factor Pcc1-domain-containing protein n=1 Tax=Dichomitus squalens TaxID=114155 RepID=A0A4V2K3Y5_9APHY|nr:transcription factor Pcc1-domain-containing protein [Dichomitus squalens]TBU62705.1 transcription factor Pcc1-domain-containing protein [Dichomitus squalens]